MPDKRDHDLRDDPVAILLRCQFTSRFEDRLHLHLVYLRIRNAKSAPAVPEHRIDLVQVLDNAI